MAEALGSRRAPAMHYPDPHGVPELRKAIADHLGERRAVLCSPEQVFVVPGSQHGLDLALQVVSKRGDRVWMEEPGYFGAHRILAAAGLDMLPIPVDDEGLRVDEELCERAPPQAVFVTPSHQYPTGSTLSLERRLRLLQAAARHGAWIIEDDYDSVFRYAGRPLPALQGLDQHGRVIYLGTFSKTMFPGLRIGYLVVPEREIDRFSAASAFLESSCFAPAQVALARFIEDGQLDRHIRRMRDVYGSRRLLLEALLEDTLAEFVDLGSHPSGMNLMAWLRAGFDDVELVRAAAGTLQAVPVSTLYLGQGARMGLLCGFAAYRDTEIRKGAETLTKLLRAHAPRARRR